MKAGVVYAKAFSANGWRVDSSFHLSDSNVLYSLLDSCPYKQTTIDGIKKDCFFGNIFTRVFVKDAEHGVPYMTASDMVKAEPLSGRFLSKKQVASLSNLILHKNWILISCSGTIGNVVYTNEQFDEVVATHDLIRLLPDETKTKGGVLYAYLASHYGYIMLTQSRFGGVVKHINPSHVSQIPIPQFPAEFQNKIDAQIKEAAALRVEANKLLEEAKRKVEEFVGVVFNKQTGYKTQSVSIQDVHKSFQLRLDPPAIISDSIKIMDRIKNSTVQLGDCKVDVWYPGVFKRTYTKNGVPYIKGSELMMTDPFKRCERLSKSRTPNIEQLYLKEDYILITCAGACGDVKLITKEYEKQNSIGSPDIVRVKSNDSLFTHSYLFAYLKTKLAYEYMQSMKYGSVIERFDADHVRSIPIVKPTKELSEEVTALIDKYKDCTYNAYCLERSAIKAVEDEIDSWGK